MKHTFKILRLAVCTVICAAMLFAFAGCSKSEDTQKVRIAYFPNITHSQALIGSANGTFEQKLEGCEVEYYTFNAGPAEIEAVFAGEIDIGYIGPVPASSGYARSDGDVVIISGCANGGAVLVAANGSGIESVGDLAGKKVAIPQLGNTQHLSLLKLLSDNGLKTTTAGGDVDVYAVANSEIKSLMANGEIDAALVPEPWGTRLTHEINAELVLDYDEIWLEGNYSVAVVIARKEFLEKNPELVEKFLDAHAELTEYINSNPEEAMKTANEKIRELTGAALEDNILSEAFSRIVFTTDPARESVEEFINISLDEGFVEPFDDVDGLFRTR